MDKIAPRRFLCCFSLRTGSIFNAVLMLFSIFWHCCKRHDHGDTGDADAGMLVCSRGYIYLPAFSCVFKKHGKYPMIITLVCIIVIAIDAVQIEKSVNIYRGVWKTAYSYIVTTIFFCLFVFVVNVWFIWGVCRKKASVVISGVVVQGIFLLYLFCALLIMIILFKYTVGLVSWILAILFFFIFMAFMVYLVVVGLEYWKEIKHRDIVIGS